MLYLSFHKFVYGKSMHIRFFESFCQLDKSIHNQIFIEVQN